MSAAVHGAITGDPTPGRDGCGHHARVLFGPSTRRFGPDRRDGEGRSIGPTTCHRRRGRHLDDRGLGPARGVGGHRGDRRRRRRPPPVVPDRRGVPRRPGGGDPEVAGSGAVRDDDLFWPEDGPGSARDQHQWTTEFPFPGSGTLNRLCVHPSIVDFAERALGTADIRHLPDPRHRLLLGPHQLRAAHAHRPEPLVAPSGQSTAPWWNLEGFLYLSDVTEADNPTRVVSMPRLGPRGGADPDRDAGRRPGALRGRAPGHRSTGVVPGLPVRRLPPRGARSAARSGPASCWPWPSSAPGRTGSATTRRSRTRPTGDGPRSPSTRRRGSSSSSASPSRSPDLERIAPRPDRHPLPETRSRSVARCAGVGSGGPTDLTRRAARSAPVPHYWGLRSAT